MLCIHIFNLYTYQMLKCWYKYKILKIGLSSVATLEISSCKNVKSIYTLYTFVVSGIESCISWMLSFLQHVKLYLAASESGVRSYSIRNLSLQHWDQVLHDKKNEVSTALESGLADQRADIFGRKVSEDDRSHLDCCIRHSILKFSFISYIYLSSYSAQYFKHMLPP